MKYQTKRRLKDIFGFLFLASLFVGFLAPTPMITRLGLALAFLFWSLREAIKTSIRNQFRGFVGADAGMENDEDMLFVRRWFIVSWLLVQLIGFLIAIAWLMGWLSRGWAYRMGMGLVAFIVVYTTITVARYQKQTREERKARKRQRRTFDDPLSENNELPPGSKKTRGRRRY